MNWTVDTLFGCWLWSGTVDKRDGRPLTWRGKRPAQAHRIVYEQYEGPIADGLELDHTCRNTRCVAPHHMEPVTRSEQEKRKAWRYRARMTKCKRGHSLSDAMVTPNGGRVCRTCNAEQGRGG